MKKFCFILIYTLAACTLSGCGGGSSESSFDYAYGPYSSNYNGTNNNSSSSGSKSSDYNNSSSSGSSYKDFPAPKVCKDSRGISCYLDTETIKLEEEDNMLFLIGNTSSDIYTVITKIAFEDDSVGQRLDLVAEKDYYKNGTRETFTARLPYTLRGIDNRELNYYPFKILIKKTNEQSSLSAKIDVIYSAPDNKDRVKTIEVLVSPKEINKKHVSPKEINKKQLISAINGMNANNYYGILGMSGQKEYTCSEVKYIYRSLMMHCHPDKNPNNKEEAGKASTRINDAYEKLKEEFGC